MRWGKAAASAARAREIEHDFICDPLCNNDSVVAAPEGYPLRHACTLRELVDSEWILTASRGGGHHGCVPRAGPAIAARRRALRYVQHHPDAAAGPQAVVHGGAPAHARPVASSSGLAVLPIEEPQPSHTVCLIYRADSPIPPVVASIVRQVQGLSATIS
ncbi:hypothetical protein AWV79_19315 [Cupriavidus sp. UYMMa02A]|nr:hypothetical protein AWV79_19315 [Cupriavidus sp. UYMMa02A]